MSKKEVKRREIKKRSKWWKFFRETIKGIEAECNIVGCNENKITLKNNTTVLERHIKNNHQIQYNETLVQYSEILKNENLFGIIEINEEKNIKKSIDNSRNEKNENDIKDIKDDIKSIRDETKDIMNKLNFILDLLQNKKD